jgi:hypothetical protein
MPAYGPNTFQSNSLRDDNPALTRRERDEGPTCQERIVGCARLYFVCDDIRAVACDGELLGELVVNPDCEN